MRKGLLRARNMNDISQGQERNQGNAEFARNHGVMGIKIVYASRIPPRRRQTLRTWLRSVRNFGKARFGRFAVFDFFYAEKICSKKSLDFLFRFFTIFDICWQNPLLCPILESSLDVTLPGAICEIGSLEAPLSGWPWAY